MIQGLFRNEGLLEALGLEDREKLGTLHKLSELSAASSC